MAEPIVAEKYRSWVSVVLSRFTGKNNRLPIDRIKTAPTPESPLVDLSEAVNVVIDDVGKISTRPGYTLASTFTGAHSAFSYDGHCLCVNDGVLYRFVPGVWSYIPLLSVGSNAKMRYCVGAGRIFFTNGNVIGEYVNGAAALFGATSAPFKTQLPAGNAIAHFNGRLYVGKGNLQLISDAKPLSRVDTRHGFKPFPNKITAIIPARDGLYVGTESAIYFAGGGNHMKHVYNKVANFGAMDVNIETVTGPDLGLNADGVFPLFMTDEGLCVGLPGGQVKNLTEDSYNLTAGTTGCAFVRRTNTGNHYITSYK